MHTWRLRLLILVALGVIASRGYVDITSVLRPRSPTYRTAVMHLLDQQGVVYHDVTVTDSCAPTYQQCYTYMGVVRVLADIEHVGEIACRERWTTCTLSVPGLRIEAAPLADTRDPLAWRWQQLWAYITQWMQGLSPSP